MEEEGREDQRILEGLYDSVTGEPINTCVSSKEIKEILQGQKEIKKDINSNKKEIEIFTTSLTRIFKLYQKHDEKIEDLEKWKEKKNITNGNTNTTIDSLKNKDGDLEEKIDTIQSDVNNMKTDIAVIKATVVKEEKENGQKWSFQEKVIIGALTAIGGPLLVLFIVFMIKTFIWHF